MRLGRDHEMRDSLLRMCNLYSMTRNIEAVRRLFRVSSNRAAAIETRDAIFPGHSAAVVRRADDGDRELVELSWGFVLPQPGKAPRRVTNTRDDKVHSVFWRDSVRLRRCLVPASSFCEPNGDRAYGPSRAPAAVSFAVIWRTHQGAIKKDGPAVTLDVFSVMTTLPNELVATVNHERMPVLLANEEEHDTWLNGSVDEALGLVKPFPPERMRIVKAGYDKRDQLE